MTGQVSPCCCRLLVGLGTCALNLADSTRGTSQLGRKGAEEGGKEGSAPSRASQKGSSPAANGTVPRSEPKQQQLNAFRHVDVVKLTCCSSN